jgi:flagellar hook protein FlgE
MIRSLYSGISGLKAEQTALDVTSNNIANVNTTGYKSNRVTFKESMAQTIKGSTRPTSTTGGTNAEQIGLGTAVASIDTILTQGSLQSTGLVTDLAIEGSAYFAYSNGTGTYYSRNGGLQLDSDGSLVSSSNGYKLQGIMAASDGTYPVGSTVDDIVIPYGDAAPANATTEVTYSGNLDSDSEGLGTVTSTESFFAAASPTSTLTSLKDSSGNSLGIESGDVLTLSAKNSSGTTSTATVTVTDTTTLTNLNDAINTLVTGIDAANSSTLNADGSITVSAASAINNLTVTSNNSLSKAYVSNAFTWGTSVAAGATATTDTVLRPAEATDLISSLYDSSGNTLGLQAGDTISINGSVGDNAISTATLDYTSTSTMQDLLDSIQSAFNLPEYDGTTDNNLSVSMDPADTSDDQLPDGSIVIRGQTGTDFALTDLSISANNSNNDSTSPTVFNANTATTDVQTARDTTQYSTSITVYDETGAEHTMTTTFTKSETPSQWTWKITTEGGESILGGDSGTVTFGQDGSVSAFTYDDGSTSFKFDPMNGSNEVDVKLNVGSAGDFTGLTQFSSDSTASADSQDGYPMGTLEDISINQSGEIVGAYTNGVSKSIAKIYVAEFNNAAGLTYDGDSMYSVSNNSGEAVMKQPNVGTSSTISAGNLEMSNVDLASEFTSMITEQRAYQANARVITTSNDMLEELVNLVR